MGLRAGHGPELILHGAAVLSINGKEMGPLRSLGPTGLVPKLLPGRRCWTWGFSEEAAAVVSGAFAWCCGFYLMLPWAMQLEIAAVVSASLWF